VPEIFRDGVVVILCGADVLGNIEKGWEVMGWVGMFWEVLGRVGEQGIWVVNDCLNSPRNQALRRF
jgi:hypothetical protein